LLNLWATMNERDREALQSTKHGISGKVLVPDTGLPVTQLSDDARRKLETVVTDRLRVYTPAVQEEIRELLNARGGMEALSVAVYGEAPGRPCREGGRWDFKLGGPRVLLDFENSRGHIHMSLWLQP